MHPDERVFGEPGDEVTSDTNPLSRDGCLLILGSLDILGIVLAGILAIPALVLAMECLAALLPAPLRASGAGERPRVAILMPAHNEESVLAATLGSIVPQLSGADRLVLVADNCTDATAGVARGFDRVDVIDRTDAGRRGKGHAIAFGIDHLRQNPPDILVMLDADCIAGAGAIDALVRQVQVSDRPAQGLYLMQLPNNPGLKDRLSTFAFLVKNHVRPRGLDRLGLPCLLTGCGMAFPWRTIEKIPMDHANLVEDMQMGIDLTMRGSAPRFCESAALSGQLPPAGAAAVRQRTRWEHGHLLTMIKQTPRLLIATLRGKFASLPVAAELCVPPLSLYLVLLMLGLTAAAIALAMGRSHWPMTILLATSLLTFVMMLVTAARFGRGVLSPYMLLLAPFYLIWKLPIYARFLFRPQKQWIRTERENERTKEEVASG